VNGSIRGRQASSAPSPASPSRAWVEVNLAAVVENARTIARVAGTRLLPVVKANAYGVGAAAVSKALEKGGLDPWGYGVATLDEGAELRAAGITRPIVVFMPGQPALFAEYERLRLTPALGDAAAITQWTARGSRPFHLEIDTGMGRSGVRWDEIDAVRAAANTPALEGCYTQFHSADRRDGSAEQQLERFERAVARLERRPALLHVANSAAAFADRRFALDLVRPGVFLYGGSPGEGFPEPRPVVSVRARVLTVRRVAAGETVSYNASWRAPRATTVATLGIGYADGVRRAVGLSGRGAVLLGPDGRRCPIVGAVTMDLMMVDTGERPARVGDVATLIGESDEGGGDDRITLEEFSAWSGELQRAVLTSLGPRLPRIYD
jgi:alanine racemase